MIANPTPTKTIVKPVRLEICSPKNMLLKIAENTGMEAKINTTFATLV